jgi:Ni/Co efflux regulator RcnB
MKVLYVALAVLALAVPSSEAQATDKDKGKDKNKGKPAKVEKHKGDTAVVVTDAGRGHRVVFVDADRQAVRTWRRETYGRNCPPGLAKKDNGCLPPGQAKKRYVVGQRLPAIVVIEPVPKVLLPRLTVAPAGYRYGYVDGDILLLDAASRLVADVIINVLD